MNSRDVRISNGYVEHAWCTIRVTKYDKAGIEPALVNPRSPLSTCFLRSTFAPLPVVSASKPPGKGLCTMWTDGKEVITGLGVRVETTCAYINSVLRYIHHFPNTLYENDTLPVLALSHLCIRVGYTGQDGLDHFCFFPLLSMEYLALIFGISITLASGAFAYSIDPTRTGAKCWFYGFIGGVLSIFSIILLTK